MSQKCYAAVPTGLGVGLAWRPELESAFPRLDKLVDWVEITTERHVPDEPVGFKTALELSQVRTVVPHGLTLSIGTIAEPDMHYLSQLRTLVQATRAPWCSDHLSLTRAAGVDIDQLTPLRRAVALARFIGNKAAQVQEFLGAPLLLENIAYYFDLGGGQSEADFINTVMDVSGCGMLLDVTNVYVNAINHGYDPYQFVDGLSHDRIIQIHIAGYEQDTSLALDTHSASVAEPVWDLLRYVLGRTGPVPTALERDQAFPKEPSEIETELVRIRECLDYSDPRIKTQVRPGSRITLSGEDTAQVELERKAQIELAIALTHRASRNARSEGRLPNDAARLLRPGGSSAVGAAKRRFAERLEATATLVAQKRWNRLAAAFPCALSLIAQAGYESEMRSDLVEWIATTAGERGATVRAELLAAGNWLVAFSSARGLDDLTAVCTLERAHVSVCGGAENNAWDLRYAEEPGFKIQPDSSIPDGNWWWIGPNCELVRSDFDLAALIRSVLARKQPDRIKHPGDVLMVYRIPMTTASRVARLSPFAGEAVGALSGGRRLRLTGTVAHLESESGDLTASWDQTEKVLRWLAAIGTVASRHAGG